MFSNDSETVDFFGRRCTTLGVKAVAVFCQLTPLSLIGLSVSVSIAVGLVMQIFLLFTPAAKWRLPRPFSLMNLLTFVRYMLAWL